MKFYGNGIVWDKELNKALCKFNKHGEFETDDKRVIDILVSLEYKHDGLVEVKEVEIEPVEEGLIVEELIVEELPFEPINHAEMTNRELRELLEAEGHVGLERKNKQQLLKLLEGE